MPGKGAPWCQEKPGDGPTELCNGSMPVIGLSALGVVFGDIGTSPLYTVKTVLALTGLARRMPGAVTLGRALAGNLDADRRDDAEICRASR